MFNAYLILNEHWAVEINWYLLSKTNGDRKSLNVNKNISINSRTVKVCSYSKSCASADVGRQTFYIVSTRVTMSHDVGRCPTTHVFAYYLPAKLLRNSLGTGSGCLNIGITCLRIFVAISWVQDPVDKGIILLLVTFRWWIVTQLVTILFRVLNYETRNTNLLTLANCVMQVLTILVESWHMKSE